MSQNGKRLLRAGLLSALAVMVGACSNYEADRSETTEPVSTTSRAGYYPKAGSGMKVSQLAFPTGDDDTSALKLFEVLPAQVRMGQDFDYEIHVHNLTGGTLQNVVVNTESTSNLEIDSSVPPATKGPGGVMQWSLGDLGPNATEVIRVKASAAKVGVAGNCVSASYNNSLCAQVNVVEPALVLTKTVTPEATTCDTIQYRFVVRNPGTGPAENVRITDTLPTGVTTADGRTAIDIAVGTLAAGEEKPFVVNAKASKAGKYENKAQATASGGLTAESATVTTTIRQPVLTIQADCTERQFVGRDIQYRFTIKNTGDAACANTVVNASIPAGSTPRTASEGGSFAGTTGVNWNLGTVPAGETRTVSFTVTPNAVGTYRANATVGCTCAQSVADDCQTIVEGIPAILLEVIDNNDPIQVGNEVTYVITVTNQGSANGTGIVITCELPEEETFVSAGGATAGTLNGRTVRFAPIASLAPGMKAEVRVTVRANAQGDVRFRTQMTSDQLRGDPVIETESTNLYQFR